MARRLTKKQHERISNKKVEQIDALKNFDPDSLFKGRVIAQHGPHLMIEDDAYQIYQANIRQNLETIVCGDYVYFTFENNLPVVLQLIPRHNELARVSYGQRKKLIAANLDQIFIVIAPKPEPSPSLIDRYLIAIREFNIPMGIIVNKADMIDESNDFSFIEDYQKAFDIKVILTSQDHPESLKQLHNELVGKTSIFVGQSGVGKSSLTNKMIPELSLQTQRISATTGLGNHTTSATTLYHMPDHQGSLIDSPGVRSFNIDHLTLNSIQNGFPDIMPFVLQCKFSNCRHLQDPGCAVQTALDDNLISERRVQSFLQIMQTAL
ncbi:ribosome small subunit-dependent GTPase A [Wohlfahrtiimonas larvae]|uniref:Small ribosomal subunit biogenesis GTPase RsgA n=1 Tax=Wohlfahrtiimonas larvae TaxID=1157986 RepID=A0ABP9MPK9_9GAMM|nr:ribosome small subunit-dependent GTPase A [Wohlfahrtiimonas larvae]